MSDHHYKCFHSLLFKNSKYVLCLGHGDINLRQPKLTIDCFLNFIW